MKYVLGRKVLDGQVGFPITESQYLAGRTAHDVIFFGLGIEQKFNILLANYEEFESELLTRTLQRSLYDPMSWGSFKEDVDAITRRIVNLLSSGRLYTDHLRHDISGAFGQSSPESTRVLALFPSEYDSSLGYRVGEALRNFIQHRGFPISTIRYENSRLKEKNDIIRSGVAIEMSVVALKVAGGFKSTVLKELEEIGDTHNLIFFLRKWVQSLGRIHRSYQEIVTGKLDEADRQFKNLIELAASEYDSVVGLIAARVDEPFSGYRDDYFIFDEPTKHRVKLQERNRRAPFVSNWYVTGGFSDARK